MAEFAQSILYLSISYVAAKFVECYFSNRRDMAIIDAVNKVINGNKFTKYDDFYYKKIKDKPLYKVFMEVLMSVGVNKECATSEILKWIQGGAISTDCDISDITDNLGSRLVNELKKTM
jgi:hypothetical protein